MSVKQRLRNLEKRVGPKTADVLVPPLHWYDKQAGDEDRPLREECPTCAAMSDEEYAAYQACCAKQKPGWAGHIVVVRHPRNESEPHASRRARCRII